MSPQSLVTVARGPGSDRAATRPAAEQTDRRAIRPDNHTARGAARLNTSDALTTTATPASAEPLYAGWLADDVGITLRVKKKSLWASRP